MKAVSCYRMSGVLVRFGRSERGAIAMLLSMMLVGLFGFVAIAVDTSVWYSTKRRLQTAVDSAARAGAHELDRGGSADDVARLMDEVRRRVHDRFGVDLHAETHVVGRRRDTAPEGAS